MKTFLRFTLVLSCILLLLGCAATYGPMNAHGGYTQKQINENTFEVSFEGNQYNTLEQVRTYLLYRCAELTLEQGLTYFLIVQDLSYSDLPDKEFVDTGLSFETTTSMSGGVNNQVKSTYNLEAMNSSPVGKYVIMMRVGKDPVHPSASLNAQEIIEANEHLIKR